MIVLPVIQEQQQEEICKYCEDNIIGGSCNTLHFQCEGKYCDQAEEMFYEDYPEKSDHYEFTYFPSKEVKEAEERIDKHIHFFTRKVNFKFSSMILHHRINSN